MAAASSRAGGRIRRSPRRRRQLRTPTRTPGTRIERSGGRLNLDAIEVRIDPRAEWKQILHEAWRINRDFFYDPNMHGADWLAVKKKYEPFLEHVNNGGDLYKVIRWMLSELAVGHSYTTPGERLNEKKTVGGGLLGCDYEIDDGRYRFKKIYSGLNFTQRPALAADRARRQRQGRRVSAGRPRRRPQAADGGLHALRERRRQDASN